jgi:hypothetical protein
MKPEKQVADAVEKAQAILAEYIRPGPRDCGETIGKLMDVLDQGSLIEAVDEVKDGRTEEERRNGPPVSSEKMEIVDQAGAVEKVD